MFRLLGLGATLGFVGAIALVESTVPPPPQIVQIAVAAPLPAPTAQSSILNATVRVELEQGGGSGTLVSRKHVLTNFHVAGKTGSTQSVRGWVTDAGRTFPVIFKTKVVGDDEALDLSLLEIDGEWPGEVAHVASVDVPLQGGDSVMAAGSPLGIQPHITKGEVSLPSVRVPGLPGERILATSPIAPGNSGGGLWRKTQRSEYELIGVSQALLQSGFTMLPHMSVFIPIKVVRDFLAANKVAL
jgi:S1-C subfamily serine protease